MEVVNELITCKFCLNRLIDPVVLPCGETICGEHANPDQSYIKCQLCQTLHEIPDEGFVRNKSVARSLEMGIDRALYGKVYSGALESINRLKSSIEAYNEIKNNKEMFIFDYFAHLKNKIDLFCEQNKMSFDKMVIEEIRSNLKDYENACKTNCSQNTFESVFGAMEELNSSSKALNSTTMDEKVWKAVDIKARKKSEEVNAKLDELKYQLLMNKSYKFIVQNFSQIQKTYGDFDIFRLDDEKKVASLKKRLYSGVYCLKSMANKRYICVPKGGQSPLVTARERPVDTEAFRFVELENGLTAIQSLSNEKFLICNLTFELLAATSNVEYINHRFEIVFAFYDTNIIGIKSICNNKFVTADNKLNKPLVAMGNSFGEMEMFKVKQFEKRD